MSEQKTNFNLRIVMKLGKRDKSTASLALNNPAILQTDWKLSALLQFLSSGREKTLRDIFWHARVFSVKVDQGCVVFPGVDFTKAGRTAQIIEIALSVSLNLHSTFMPYYYACKELFKSWVLRFVPCAQLYEIDPCLLSWKVI